MKNQNILTSTNFFPNSVDNNYMTFLLENLFLEWRFSINNISKSIINSDFHK